MKFHYTTVSFLYRYQNIQDGRFTMMNEYLKVESRKSNKSAFNCFSLGRALQSDSSGVCVCLFPVCGRHWASPWPIGSTNKMAKKWHFRITGQFVGHDADESSSRKFLITYFALNWQEIGVAFYRSHRLKSIIGSAGLKRFPFLSIETSRIKWAIGSEIIRLLKSISVLHFFPVCGPVPHLFFLSENRPEQEKWSYEKRSYEKWSPDLAGICSIRCIHPCDPPVNRLWGLRRQRRG